MPLAVPETTPAFKAYPQFNNVESEAIVSSRTSVDPSSLLRHFKTDSPPDQIARAQGERRATSIKELIESFEFFQQTRKYVHSSHLIDLCCGHGLTGMLFAALDREVERVTLVDARQPGSHSAMLDALGEVAPWTRDKIEYFELDTKRWQNLSTEEGCTTIGVHACGELTDKCLEFAVDRNLSTAVMPCCYPHGRCPAPLSVQQALGPEQAFDVDRTYRLESAGYTVRWRYIPPTITPMNRILIGKRPV